MFCVSIGFLSRFLLMEGTQGSVGRPLQAPQRPVGLSGVFWSPS